MLVITHLMYVFFYLILIVIGDWWE